MLFVVCVWGWSVDVNCGRALISTVFWWACFPCGGVQVTVRAALRSVGTGNTNALECLASLCVKFKGAASLALSMLTPGDMAKLLSDIEGVLDNEASDEGLALLCFQLLTALAKVRGRLLCAPDPVVSTCGGPVRRLLDVFAPPSNQVSPHPPA